MTTTIVHDLRDTLEGKEVEIYRLLCQNLTNVDIAAQMDMPRPTVQWHLRNIYKKLGVETCTGDIDTQLPRRRAISYSGTKIERVVTLGASGEKTFTVKQIRTAAKKVGCGIEQIDNLISFLEMEL